VTALQSFLEHGRLRPGRGNRVRQALQAIAAGDQHVLHAPVLQLSEHPEPDLGAFPAGRAHPHAQHVPFPLDADPHRHIDRAVGDLPVADPHEDAVDQQHRVDRVQRPIRPLGHVRHDRVRHSRHQVPGDLAAVHISEVIGDIPAGHALGVEADHLLVEPGQPACVLARSTGTSTGSKVPARSRGTRICTSPTSVRTVLAEEPLRMFPSGPGTPPCT
jgi:hypothetical protein